VPTKRRKERKEKVRSEVSNVMRKYVRFQKKPPPVARPFSTKQEEIKTTPLENLAAGEGRSKPSKLVIKIVVVAVGRSF
jgi:hypothetical protein